jgi:hypothetical protein
MFDSLSSIVTWLWYSFKQTSCPVTQLSFTPSKTSMARRLLISLLLMYDAPSDKVTLMVCLGKIQYRQNKGIPRSATVLKESYFKHNLHKGASLHGYWTLQIHVIGCHNLTSWTFSHLRDIMSSFWLVLHAYYMTCMEPELYCHVSLSYYKLDIVVCL